MRIDGRDMAKRYGETLAEKVAGLSPACADRRAPILRVFVLSKDKATEQFIAIKKRAGESVGAMVEVIDMPETTTTDELVDMIATAVEQTDGIIVQLPLPSGVDTERVLAALPASHDVDGIGGASELLPPVVAAFEHILKENKISVSGKKVVVLGHGRLVGKPAARWFEHEGADVTVCDKSTPDMCAAMIGADIIVLGAGAPHLVKPDMIKEGSIILDAGTSEAGGKVVGDADPACEMKASLFTPVPGGIGPLAVMMIFKNLYTLATAKGL